MVEVLLKLASRTLYFMKMSFPLNMPSLWNFYFKKGLNILGMDKENDIYFTTSTLEIPLNENFHLRNKHSPRGTGYGDTRRQGIKGQIINIVYEDCTGRGNGQDCTS